MIVAFDNTNYAVKKKLAKKQTNNAEYGIKAKGDRIKR